MTTLSAQMSMLSKRAAYVEHTGESITACYHLLPPGTFKCLVTSLALVVHHGFGSVRVPWTPICLSIENIW